MTTDTRHVDTTKEDADLLISADEVEAAINSMAADISDTLKNKNPLILCIMLGGLVLTGKLLTRLNFPLTLDYIHPSRYRGKTQGGDIHWHRHPRNLVKGRTVLLLDDILDEGLTLKAVIEACETAAASAVYTAVLVDKQNTPRPGIDKADFSGVSVANRYVFGYGMDYQNYLRNAAGIYAIKES